jgi:hypothetical protein
MNLLEMLLTQKNGALVDQVAGAMRLDPAQARAAVEQLVPALSRGISRNAASEQGLSELVNALSRGGHARYVDEPEALARPEARDEGNAILGHVFGSKDVSRQVASRAAENTGLDTDVLKKLLPVVASAVMGAMAKQGFGNAAPGADSRGLGQGQAPAGTDAGIGGMLTSFLDSDGDGSIVDDLLGMAGRFMR